MTSTEQHAKLSRSAPAPLWRAMRAFLCLLFDMFGEPRDIAARGWLDPKSRALIMPWLRAGEAFLRRLLFIEALALCADALGPRQKRLARQRPRTLCEFHADKPEKWRVSFRLLPGARNRPPGRGRRSVKKPALGLARALLTPPPALTSQAIYAPEAPAVARSLQRAPHAPRESGNAWPIAERFESMLRAYNAPHEAAQRLARTLLCNKQRALRALRPAHAHIVDLFGAPNFARCNAIVASRRRKWEQAHARPGGV